MFYWQKTKSESGYYAVYLRTGDLYFGKLDRFPRLSLSDAWFLDRGADKRAMRLARFSEAFWSPKGPLYLNDENIVWMTSLDSEGSVVEYMKNPVPAPFLFPPVSLEPIESSASSTNE